MSRHVTSCHVMFYHLDLVPLLDLLGRLGHCGGPVTANRPGSGGPRPCVGALPPDTDRAQHAAPGLLEEVLLLLNSLSEVGIQTDRYSSKTAVSRPC